MAPEEERLVVGITGASGAVYGVRLLESLRKYAPGWRLRLIVTAAGEKTLRIETGLALSGIAGLADAVEDNADPAAPVSSGSFRTRGMVVAPCSMRALSDIANCRGGDLLTRAADVTLKEGRKLVLVPREAPLSRGHLEMMARAAGLGAVIVPPVPAFYHHPKSVDDIVNHTVGKVLDQLGVEHGLFERWGGA